MQKDWTDLKKRKLDQSVRNRLDLIEERGYPATFLWSAQESDVATKWTPDEVRYTKTYLRISCGVTGDDAA